MQQCQRIKKVWESVSPGKCRLFFREFPNVMPVDGKYRRAQFPVCFCAAATDRSQQVSTTFQYTISKTRRRTAPLFFSFFIFSGFRAVFLSLGIKRCQKKKPGLSGEKTVWQKCFFFQFFPSPEGNIAHILGGVSFVKMLRFFPGFDAYFEFFAFLPRSARL